MSLKAKIEAVIYASEEPVTLAQLVSLLGQEAQGELDRLSARQGTLHLAGSEDAETAPEEPGEKEAAEGEVAVPGREGLEVASQEPASESSGGEHPDLVASEKRAARERERRLREFVRETADA